MIPRRVKLSVGALLSLIAAACDSGDDRRVVVYCSLDEPFSRPVLDLFERQTGIRVLDRYDTEVDKTVGLAHRLVEERQRPRADVFWNSEVLQTVSLAGKGVFAPYRSPERSTIPVTFHGAGELWTGFAARVRVLIYNTRLVPEGEAPRSIADLAAPRWRGRAAMALPLAGTTSTHAGALRATLGADAAERFFRDLAANDVRIVDGNATVRDLVAAGEVAIGLTDTDDARVGIKRGDPLRIVFPDQAATLPGRSRPLGALLIPNTVALVRGGPNPGAGRALIDFLLSPVVEARLARGASAQIPVRPGLDPPESLGAPGDLRLMEVSYEEAARGLQEIRSLLEELFLR